MARHIQHLGEHRLPRTGSIPSHPQCLPGPVDLTQLESLRTEGQQAFHSVRITGVEYADRPLQKRCGRGDVRHSQSPACGRQPSSGPGGQLSDFSRRRAELIAVLPGGRQMVPDDLIWHGARAERGQPVGQAFDARGQERRTALQRHRR